MIGGDAVNAITCDTRQTSWLDASAGKGERASERQMPRAISRRGFLRLGGVGLAGAALSGAAGCGGNLLGSDKKVVRFFTGTEETATQERAVTEIQVNRFEEQHPQYTLEREAIKSDEIRKVIQSRLRSDEPPDVFTYDTGPGFGGVLAEAGLLLPLDDVYQQRGWSIYEWAKQSANELKGQGIIPFAFGNQEQWPAGHLFSIGVSNVLGREGLDDILYTNGRWDIPEVEEAINLLFREFVESGYYPEGLSSLSSDGANALFYTGKAAMNPTGTWLVPEIVQTVQDFEVGFFPFPSIEGSGISPPAGLGSGLFVAKKASTPQGAIDFIDYLLEESTARLAIETLNVIPAQPVNPQGLEVPELFKEVLEDLSASPEARYFGYNIDVLAPQSFNEMMFNGFQDVLNGTRSPVEQAEALQDAWATAKKQGKIATQG